jgi:HEPN domain-containing protein
MTEESQETAAAELESAADELERAVAHLRVAARHFREGEIPRACAHAFAAEGHMIEARRQVEHRAVVHRTKSHAD